jgi:hypothetical protein
LWWLGRFEQRIGRLAEAKARQALTELGAFRRKLARVALRGGLAQTYGWLARLVAERLGGLGFV